jgi:hypothetical protein
MANYINFPVAFLKYKIMITNISAKLIVAIYILLFFSCIIFGFIVYHFIKGKWQFKKDLKDWEKKFEEYRKSCLKK